MDTRIVRQNWMKNQKNYYSNNYYFVPLPLHRFRDRSSATVTERFRTFPNVTLRFKRYQALPNVT